MDTRFTGMHLQDILRRLKVEAQTSGQQEYTFKGYKFVVGHNTDVEQLFKRYETYWYNLSNERRQSIQRADTFSYLPRALENLPYKDNPYEVMNWLANIQSDLLHPEGRPQRQRVIEALCAGLQISLPAVHTRSESANAREFALQQITRMLVELRDAR